MTLKPLVAASFDWDAVWAWLSGIPIRLVLIVVFGIVANVAARRSINHIVARIPEGERESRSNSRSRTVGAVLKSSITVMIVAVVAMLILSQLGINLAPLIASAGVAGVALGFGAQTLVRDILAGMFVLIEDQYGVGDVVDVGPASGTVEKITLRATVVRDEAGTVWHVPNGEIRRAGSSSTSPSMRSPISMRCLPNSNWWPNRLPPIPTGPTASSSALACSASSRWRTGERPCGSWRTRSQRLNGRSSDIFGC